MTVSSSITTHSYIPAGAMLAESLAGLVFLNANDLVVTDPDDAVQVLGTDYEITGNGRTGAGSIRTLRAYAGGLVLTVTRVTPSVQEANIEAQQPLPAEAIETELDRRALIEQETRAGFNLLEGRVLKAVPGELGGTLPPLATGVGKFLSRTASDEWFFTDGGGADDALRADLGTGPGSALVKFSPGGTGAVDSDVQSELRRLHFAARYGLDPTGTVDQITVLTNARISCQTGLTDNPDGPGGRSQAGKMIMPPGRFLIEDVAQLAPANGLVGFMIEGAGRGVTTFVFSDAASAIAMRSSRAFQFSNCTLEGLSVDTEQTAIVVDQAGGTNPLRSWTFDKVDFVRFYKCFNVTGASMCSEVVLNECGFYQCYYGMENSNDQAVNWVWQNSNWEQESLVTAKNVGLSAVFKLNKGSFVTWRGGSIIPTGRILYFTPSGTGVYPRTSHRYNFENVRIELIDVGGTHVPIIDRQDAGYASGSNSPVITIRSSTILFRGAIPSTVVLARLWANCKVTFEDVECEGGKVVGILDAVTANQPGALHLIRADGITYEADITNRVNSHDQHNVTIIPGNNPGNTQPIVQLRLASIAVPNSVSRTESFIRTSTGSVPIAGTSVLLPAHPDGTFFRTIGVDRRGPAAGQALTVQLRDQADTTTYATMTINAGETNKEVYIGLEMGVDIPTGTALMLKNVGSPEVVKGAEFYTYR